MRQAGRGRGARRSGGATDILIASPIAGDIKIQRLLELLDRARVIVAVDTHPAATVFSQAISASGRTLDIYVEVNTGQDRAGARAGQEAVDLALAVSRMPGLRVTGVMTHEGPAGFSAPDDIATIAGNAGRALVDTADRIRDQSIDVADVSVGSTPASWFTPRVPGITEMRPGSYVFHDNNAFRHGRMGPARYAARVVSTVVGCPAGHPKGQRAIIDAGSKRWPSIPAPATPVTASSLDIQLRPLLDSAKNMASSCFPAVSPGSGLAIASRSFRTTSARP